MLNGYRTLAATGRILGVSAQRVLDFIERGPLVGRRIDGELKVHDEDLMSFRRPTAIATTRNNSPRCDSELLQEESSEGSGDASVASTLIIRPCGDARKRAAAGRNTMTSAGFRALRNTSHVEAAADRFDRLVSPEPNTGCFLWTGAMDRNGYGYFRLTSDQVVLAHRFSFVRAFGRIEEGLEVDHCCANKWCVRPEHLEAVTRQENLRRRDTRRAALGLPDNCAIARAVMAAGRHLRLVQNSDRGNS